MSPERTYAFGIAPSAGLAWGFGLSALGPTGVALGACAGAAVGLIGGWALGRLARRAERRWLPGLATFGFLVALWLGLVILPAALHAGLWGGLPRPGVRPVLP